MSTISPYGSRSQIAALTRAVEDALGNKDGIGGNESRPAGSVGGGPLASNPLVNRLQSTFAPGLSTRDEQASLAGFVREREVAWGAPVTTLGADEVPHFEAFRTEKAAALVRFDRQPGEVTEGFLRAAGKIDGEAIAPREIFWQRWAPTAAPSGKVVVVSPGFQETGRNFLEQVQLLNAQGHDVVLMDHQWAGYTKGNPGGLDRGYGVARDVAATAAFAQQLADREYAGKPHEVVLFGNSMGAGPGVLGALALNDAGKVELEGAQMPKGLSAVLQAPFLQMKGGLLNKGLEVMSRVPLLKELPLPSMGLPVLTHDDAAAAKLAQHVVLEGVVARPQAMSAADADLANIWKLVESGTGPTGRVSIIHGDRDPLADVEGSRRLAGLLGDRAQLRELSSGNHVLEEEAGAQRHVLDALGWLD